MAELDPGSGGNGTVEPRTIIVGISGSNSVESYTLAPGLAQYVQAVYVEVDTTGSGDTQPLLTVKEQAGVVIAKKRQGDVIDGSASGSATWALRLDDENLAGTLRHPVGFYTADPTAGNPIPAGTHTAGMSLTFAGAGGGIDLLDTTNIGAPNAWVVKRPGFYTFMARIGMDPDPVVAWPAGNLMKMDLTPSADPPPANFWATQWDETWPLNNTFGAAINTIAVSRFMPVYQAGTSPYYWSLTVSTNYAGAWSVSGFLEVIQHY